ncbi:hypothetical protein A6770_34675 [Nostoc minutum NIES-26]|uniref:Uncharacterized protein n=1 Tax=Nostoc minutum NIES-26 TaxID=1844469 RepID=A0A367S358_9NOSO|nr:hypothetical protein A6770_34675 [Nostoc minutum NIES-26]
MSLTATTPQGCIGIARSVAGWMIQCRGCCSSFSFWDDTVDGAIALLLKFPLRKTGKRSLWPQASLFIYHQFIAIKIDIK